VTRTLKTMLIVAAQAPASSSTAGRSQSLLAPSAADTAVDMARSGRMARTGSPRMDVRRSRRMVGVRRSRMDGPRSRRMVDVRRSRRAIAALRSRLMAASKSPQATVAPKNPRTVASKSHPGTERAICQVASRRSRRRRRMDVAVMTRMSMVRGGASMDLVVGMRGMVGGTE
jgi:hypothetical protein